MHLMGLHFSSSGTVKSAKVVGEVLEYHPHGDIVVYDSMIRMAQTFSMRYPLIHGQAIWDRSTGIVCRSVTQKQNLPNINLFCRTLKNCHL